MSSDEFWPGTPAGETSCIQVFISFDFGVFMVREAGFKNGRAIWAGESLSLFCSEIMRFVPTQTELVDWNHSRTFFSAVLSGDLSQSPDVNEQVLAMTELEIRFALGN